MSRFILFFILFITLIPQISCSEKESLVNLEQESFSGVGKWKIRKKTVGNSSKQNSCDVTDLILNSNLSFKIYTSDNAIIIGEYEVLSAKSISLSDYNGTLIGNLNNIIIENNNISFNINLEGICQSDLAGEKDESYDESKTYIADVEFEKYLIEQGWDDLEDNFVLTSNISDIENLDIQERNLTSLVGIEEFRSLKFLSAGRNNISGVIDFSFNTKLIYVDIPNNPLKEVYFKNNTFLESLGLYSTYTLEILQISNSPNLFDLGVHDTKLKEIDLSNSPKIEHLRIWDSELSELDLSNQNSLKYLYAYNIFSNNSSSLILPQTNTLEMIWIDRNNIVNLDLSKNNNLKVVSCRDCQLEEITLPDSQSLYGLLVERNQLTTLNLTNNPNLRILRAESNLLSCISAHSNLIGNIPPTCKEANIPINYDDDPNFSCYNPWNIVDFAFNSVAENYPDSWMYDPDVIVSTNCN